MLRRWKGLAYFQTLLGQEAMAPISLEIRRATHCPISHLPESMRPQETLESYERADAHYCVGWSRGREAWAEMDWDFFVGEARREHVHFDSDIHEFHEYR